MTLEWKWVSGDNRIGRPASYGTKGLPLPSNVPEGAGEAATWIDSEDIIWLFGGRTVNGQVLNALWKFDTTRLEWIWVSGSDHADAQASYGTKGAASPSNVPGARRSAFSWQGASGELWLFGGYGFSAASGYLNDLWRFDPATLEWAWMSGSSEVDQAGLYGRKGVGSSSNFPGGRAAGVSWKNSQGELWLFGGGGCDRDGVSGVLNDLWRYHSLEPTPPPPSDVRVTLAPEAAEVDRTESVQFRAMVHHSPTTALNGAFPAPAAAAPRAGRSATPASIRRLRESPIRPP